MLNKIFEALTELLDKYIALIIIVLCLFIASVA
jgi:hypothetical protein